MRVVHKFKKGINLKMHIYSSRNCVCYYQFTGNQWNIIDFECVALSYKKIFETSIPLTNLATMKVNFL